MSEATVLGFDVLASMRDERARGNSALSDAEPFVGRSHAEVLALTFETPAELVEDIVPAGVLVTVAGLPEVGKGWLCAKLADVVARGEGELLGRRVLIGGPVGYFWQDDSERMEAERVQLYSRVHSTPDDLPLRWFLNEGAILPDDLERLRSTVERFGFVLVVLDSVYNFTPGLDLKDRDVGQLFARLKAEVCDPTGCTVVVVDHMPWATETNRRRTRAYGDVFKGAAARAGIYLDADGDKLYVEARGNNVAGIPRTLVHWDRERLEFVLADRRPDEGEAVGFRPTVLMERVSRFLEGLSEPVTRKAVEEARLGRAQYVRQALGFLQLDGYIAETRGPRGARLVASLNPYREGATSSHLVPTSSRSEVDDLVPTSSTQEPLSDAL